VKKTPSYSINLTNLPTSPRLALKSPPRSSQQPLIITQRVVEEYDEIDKDNDVMLALAEAQVTLAREEAEADTKAVDKGKGKNVEAKDIVELEAAVKAAVTRRR